MTAPTALFAALLASAPAARAAQLKLPAKRAYTGDLIMSFYLPHGWTSKPHELAHMNDHPRDLWTSDPSGSREIRFDYAAEPWAKLELRYGGRKGAERYKTKSGINAILVVNEPEAAGAVDCEGSRFVLRSHGMNYAELRLILDGMACRTRKPDPKAPKPKKRPSAEPEL